jgi:hypothetical protein
MREIFSFKVFSRRSGQKTQPALRRISPLLSIAHPAKKTRLQPAFDNLPIDSNMPTAYKRRTIGCASSGAGCL